MLELMIERWKNSDGSSHYLWSVWEAGSRIGMGRAAATPEVAESDGLGWCRQTAGRAPDRVTRL
jgi:hypothetical protein